MELVGPPSPGGAPVRPCPPFSLATGAGPDRTVAGATVTGVAAGRGVPVARKCCAVLRSSQVAPPSRRTCSSAEGRNRKLGVGHTARCRRQTC